MFDYLAIKRYPLPFETANRSQGAVPYVLFMMYIDEVCGQNYCWVKSSTSTGTLFLYTEQNFVRTLGETLND